MKVLNSALRLSRRSTVSWAVMCGMCVTACADWESSGADGEEAPSELGQLNLAIEQRPTKMEASEQRSAARHVRRPRAEYMRQIGREVAIGTHLKDGEEYELEPADLIEHGRLLFAANWTHQEGGGRPLTKGTGAPLADPASALVFPRNFNRLSAPDANSCGGCHNLPFPGGGGDFVTNVFVLAQRFDFASFDAADLIPGRGAVDEAGAPVLLDGIANSRATLGMFGSGFVEMLARQMTRDLRRIRDTILPGESAALVTKGVSFGTLARLADGSWDARRVEGLAQGSVASASAVAPPSLIIRPFHQAGAVVSLREFTNNAFNHHHGIQSSERFGAALDPDGDGFVDEMSRADVTAVTLWQATLPVPGRVIPRIAEIEDAVLLGEQRFEEVGCSGCHRSTLPLDGNGFMFVEPNPFNPPGNLQVEQAPPLEIDLTDDELPGPRLYVRGGVVQVPAYTDLKLHDITNGPDDPNVEPLNMHFPAGSAGFHAGNSRFLTKKLWGAANEPPYFHHGKYTTLREAIEAHGGEALSVTSAFKALSRFEQACVVEFLKTLQVLPAGATSLVLDERGHPRRWPPVRAEREKREREQSSVSHPRTPH